MTFVGQRLARRGTLGDSRRSRGIRLGLVLRLAVCGPLCCLRLEPSVLAQAPSTAATPLQPRAEGTLVVPIVDKAGKRTEPMILVPLSARTPSTSNSAPSRVLVARTNGPATSPPKAAFDERVLTLQVALARQGISSGSFDGMLGPQTRAAVRAFQQKQHLPVTGVANGETWALLELSAPLYTNYVVAEEDLAALQPLGRTWLAKSEQDRLAYETILELVAEKTHSNPKLLRWLNPEVGWSVVAAGTSLKVVQALPAPVEEKAAFLRICLGERRLHAYGASSNLLVHFPCSIAARVEKRPLGEELHVAAVAPNPNYTFDPAVFPESEEGRQLGRKLILQPGPNNPVGTVWLSLDKPGYGIHGTPKPEEVGRTESHGCFRLANWNAEHLLALVSVGTPVFVDP